LLLAFTRERIELGGTAEVGILPFGGDPALLLEPMQGGIQRTLPDREDVARAELDALRYAPTVERLPCNRLEDQ
jgi:hypothetical protein